MLLLSRVVALAAAPTNRYHFYINHLFPFIMAQTSSPEVAGIVAAIKKCLTNYANFNGRASLPEFWWFFLLTFVVGVIPFINFLSILLIVPYLAVSWRRMHDIGKAGGWWFINLIPLVGFIIFVVWAARPSEPVANRFGDVPGPLEA